MRPEEEKTEIEKLEEEIDSLNSKIKNTEYDLSNMFKGNAFLTKKLETANQALTEKQQLLEKIKSQPESFEKLKQIEHNIEEEIISKEQEEIVQDLIEEEL
jgi:predicted  nucleic acid-binding Zn-ribbon protein